MVAAIRFYQVVFRPLMPWGCKFHPSCSVFAVEAIERHGFARGTRLAAARLLRCRPGVFGGFDPVPDLDPEFSEKRKRIPRPLQRDRDDKLAAPEPS